MHRVCGAGKYSLPAVNPAVQDAVCVPCRGGQFQSKAGQSSCQDCATGKYAPHLGRGEEFCINCPPGKFQAAEGKSFCSACLSGKYNILYGSVGCMDEPTDTAVPQPNTTAAPINLADDCPSGKYTVFSTDDHVVHSDTNYFTADGLGHGHAHHCVDCPAGKYMAYYGSRYCELCDAGQWQNSRGMSSCADCEPGTFSKTGAATCQACAAGHYQPAQVSAACIACDPGRYGAAVLSQASVEYCVSCAAGTVQPLEGQTACVVNMTTTTTGAPTTAAPTTTTAAAYAYATERAGLYTSLRLINTTIMDFVAHQHMFEKEVAALLSWPRYLVKVREVDGVRKVEHVTGSDAYMIEHGNGHLQQYDEPQEESMFHGAPLRCLRWTVHGLGDDSAQKKRAGDYWFTSHSWGGRPVYKSSDGNYLYYHPERKWWLIGPDLGSKVAGMVIANDATSPAGLPDGQWFVYDSKRTHSWKAAPGVDLRCNPVPYVEVKLQLKAKGCDNSDTHNSAMARMASAIPNVLSMPVTGLVARLAQGGLPVMTARVTGAPHVRDCMPEILLDVPHPVNAHSLNVHCHYDGSKLKVTHTGRLPSHNAFNCYHRYDKVTAAWDCFCHSWDTKEAVRTAENKGNDILEDRASNLRGSSHSVPAQHATLGLGALRP
jgi:hypothetical protein